MREEVEALENHADFGAHPIDVDIWGQNIDAFDIDVTGTWLLQTVQAA
jgi:hypothetical protein